MAKYNAKKVAPVVATVVTHQGGTGYQLKPELELMSLLANGISNTYYEKETEQDKRLASLIQEVSKKDAELVAKMLVYTRTTLGQRSVTHRGAVALMPAISGREFTKFLFTKRDRKENAGGLIYRLDDMLEIAACYFALNPGKRLPNAMVKGFKQALEESDAYELAKYQGKDKTVSLVDLINLVHPKPSEKMKQAFHDLIHGELKQFNTVEDKNTKAGQEVAAKVKEGKISKADAEVELKAAKEANFVELVDNKVIGYLALLRNLRNILNTSTDAKLISDTINQLTDEKAIKKSLVFPHQIDLALEVLLSELGTKATPFVVGLNKAYELAIPNLSELGATGRTAVVYDSSGSMTSKIHINKGKYGSVGAIEKAALMAATLAKGLNADVYTFGDRCKQLSYNPLDSINTIKNNFARESMGGTAFSTIFPALQARYDRIFIISDEQGQDQIGNTLSNYKTKFAVDPYIYCINLCGYGTTMFKPGSKVFQLFGYSAELYEIIKKQETDFNALLNEVKKINFEPKVKKSSLKKDLAS